MPANTSSPTPQQTSTPTASMDSPAPLAPIPMPEEAPIDTSYEHYCGDVDEEDDRSTICYEAEPFDTFRHKVAALVAEKFDCDKNDVRTEHVKGGAYNRVVGVHVQTAIQQRSCFDWAKGLLRRILRKAAPTNSAAYVVRLPRGDGDSFIDTQVATLEAVEARLPCPTPQVVHYDVGSENILEKPYMIQKFIPGRRFFDLLDSTNSEQKQDFLLKFIQLVNQITSVEAAPGEISVDNLTSPTTEPVRVNKIAPLGMDELIPSTTLSSVDHLLEACAMRRADGIADRFCYTDVWDGFRIMCKSLHTQGLLEGPCVLVHSDLQSYNLLGEINSPSTVKITGVIDWDDAHFAPKFMAYLSPFWLWTSEGAKSDTDHVENNATVEPADHDGQLLQRAFRDNVSEEYERLAFSPEAMLARRMYYFLRFGLSDSDVPRAEAVIAEWDQLHPEDHAVLGESYFLEDGSWRVGAYERCINFG